MYYKNFIKYFLKILKYEILKRIFPFGNVKKINKRIAHYDNKLNPNELTEYEQIAVILKEKIIKRNSYMCSYVSIASLDTKIGSYCSIADNVSIGTTHHPTNWLSTHPFCYFKGKKFKKTIKQCEFDYNTPVTIGNDVWIGKSAIIMDGITVEDGAIIGANAVVTHDVPPYAIVAGVPARIIKYRFDENTIKELLELKWWELPEEEIANLPFNDIKACIETLKFIRETR